MAREYNLRLNELRARLSTLLDTWYYMKEYVEPELWRRYQILFGDLEERLAEKNIELQRIEFLIENRGVRFDTERLRDLILEESGEDAEAGVKASLLEDEKPEVLANIIYRDLVKLIHPDVCRDKELTRRYWHQVKDAREKNDVERLSTYRDIIHESHDDREILKSIRKLEQKVTDYEEKISQLKVREPFSYESLFGNSIWVESKRNRLLNKILLADIRISQKHKIMDCYSGKQVS